MRQNELGRQFWYSYGRGDEEMEFFFYYWELEIKESKGKQTFGIDLKLK